ncbi:MAG: 50S ribosomal protein L24e [archaeon]
MKCTFCGKDITEGTGTMYIKKDCKVYYFCSSKCNKNLLKLGRKARTIEWTAEYAKLKKAKTKGA